MSSSKLKIIGPASSGALIGSAGVQPGGSAPGSSASMQDRSPLIVPTALGSASEAPTAPLNSTTNVSSASGSTPSSRAAT